MPDPTSRPRLKSTTADNPGWCSPCCNGARTESSQLILWTAARGCRFVLWTPPGSCRPIFRALPPFDSQLAVSPPQAGSVDPSGQSRESTHAKPSQPAGHTMDLEAQFLANHHPRPRPSNLQLLRAAFAHPQLAQPSHFPLLGPAPSFQVRHQPIRPTAPSEHGLDQRSGDGRFGSRRPRGRSPPPAVALGRQARSRLRGPSIGSGRKRKISTSSTRARPSRRWLRRCRKLSRLGWKPSRMARLVRW